MDCYVKAMARLAFKTSSLLIGQFFVLFFFCSSMLVFLLLMHRMMRVQVVFKMIFYKVKKVIVDGVVAASLKMKT